MNSAPANFRDHIYQSLLGLATEEGINASGKDEIYGCTFGRDSALTILKIIRVNQRSSLPQLMQVAKKALLNMCSLQGQTINIESGEEPGKFIHEFRKEKHEHLTRLSRMPWYLYPDGFMRNYDSLDATPLVLIAFYKYWRATGDDEFLISVLPGVEMGLNWIITFGDKDKDGLLDYTFHNERKYGGLSVQSWTDSQESLRQADGLFPKYPISPVEVQGYAWLALRLWAGYYADKSPAFASKLYRQAELIKKMFNQLFIFKESGYYFAGQAIDGNKQLIKTVTGNPLISLWAADESGCIVEEKFIEGMVNRVFMPDLFDPHAGIRTMSTRFLTYNPEADSYHNGSFWPVLNGLIHEGLENFGFYREAKLLKKASLEPLYYFNSPIELYMRNDSGFFEYKSSRGQTGCRVQAWSAASALDWLTPA